MALKGRPKSRPRVGDSEVGDRGRPSSCVLEPFQKGQLISERFLLKVFCCAGSAEVGDEKGGAGQEEVRLREKRLVERRVF